MGRVSRDIAAAIARAEADVLASGIGRGAPQEGDVVPDFTLPDANDTPVRLYSLLEQGPVVLVFYRGGWCPFCTLSLRAMQRVVPRLRGKAQVIGVSPELPVHARATAEDNGITFPLLHDAGNRAAGAWDLAQELHPALQPIYARIGHAIPEINGTGDWMLPIPAGFVIAPDRRVVLTRVDPRVYIRIEPDDVVRAVAALNAVRSEAG